MVLKLHVQQVWKSDSSRSESQGTGEVEQGALSISLKDLLIAPQIQYDGPFEVSVLHAEVAFEIVIPPPLSIEFDDCNTG